MAWMHYKKFTKEDLFIRKLSGSDKKIELTFDSRSNRHYVLEYLQEIGLIYIASINNIPRIIWGRETFFIRTKTNDGETCTFTIIKESGLPYQSWIQCKDIRLL